MKKYLSLVLILSVSNSYSMLRSLANTLSRNATNGAARFYANNYKAYTPQTKTFIDYIKQIPSQSNHDCEITRKVNILKRLIQADIGPLEKILLETQSPQSFRLMQEIKTQLESNRCARDLVSQLLKLKEPV